MPIYEFKCLKCHECMEILIMGGDDDPRQMTCAQCGGHALERIISTTNFSMGSAPAKASPSTQSRACSSGSCTTWNLPGHSG